jgi:hypothetical protein
VTDEGDREAEEMVEKLLFDQLLDLPVMRYRSVLLFVGDILGVIWLSR